MLLQTDSKQGNVSRSAWDAATLCARANLHENTKCARANAPFPKLHIGCENDHTHNSLISTSQIWYGGWFGPWKCGHCWFWSISVQQFCTPFLLFSNTWSKLWTAARGLQNSACCSEPVFTLPSFTVLPSLAMWASCNVNAAKNLILQAFPSYIAKSPNRRKI